MSCSPIVQPLDPDQVRSLLNIDDVDLRWLVTTQPLPSILIHAKLRFDSADVVRFVTTYKNIQRGRHLAD